MRLPAILLAAMLAFPQAEAQDLTIKVNVNLVQLDVTVVDKTGSHVPDLSAADFEVSRDGKKQVIKSAIWVAGRRPNVVEQTPLLPTSTALPARPLRPSEVRRTVALLIDDLSLSFASSYYARDALKKFVQEQIQPGDLVALFRSSGGANVLQQFTTDKAQLLNAIERTVFRNWNSVDSLAPIASDPMEQSGDPSIAAMAMEQRLREDINNRQRQDVVTAGMLGSASFIVNGLRELPGRKSLIVISESLQLADLPRSMTNPGMSAAMSQMPGAMGGIRDRTVLAIRNLVDIANRSGVVFYTIDPRGLVSTALTAADQPSSDPRKARGQVVQREVDFQMSQDGLATLAEETGGVFYRNRNDLGGALKEALNDQEGYYLIAFQPDDETFEKTKTSFRYNNLKVKVKRSGLKIRYRHGFYGIPDSDRLPAARTPLQRAMSSPFRALEIPLKVTPIFFDDERDGPLIHTLVHVDTSKLAYVDVPAEAEDKNQVSWKQTVLDELIVLYDETGGQVESVSKTHTIKARGDTFERLREKGVVQTLSIPVKKPGPYQLRAAIVDRAGQQTGSSSQFIVVPNLNDKVLATSDLVLSSGLFSEKGDPDGGPGLRIVRPGEKLKYALFVYNAKFNKEVKSANLETQVLLYREGKVVFSGKKTPFQPEGFVEGKKLSITGDMSLGKSIKPGEYVLQFAVRDLEAGKKRQFAVKSIDFEIRP